MICLISLIFLIELFAEFTGFISCLFSHQSINHPHQTNHINHSLDELIKYILQIIVMTATVQVSPSSVFVVSGGAKGITAQCTIKLAQHQPCKFILLGRSEITTAPESAHNC